MGEKSAEPRPRKFDGPFREVNVAITYDDTEKTDTLRIEFVGVDGKKQTATIMVRISPMDHAVLMTAVDGEGKRF